MNFMQKTTRLKVNLKLLVPLIVIVLVVAAVFLSTQTGSGEDALSEGIGGGELALTSVGRNYESLEHFVRDDEKQAEQLLEAARASLENAMAKLGSAGRTDDEYVLSMLDNYLTVSQASDVMAQGVENLLAISNRLDNAVNYYLRGEYESASTEASYCLQVLTPLLSHFETCNENLDDLDYRFIPSGQRSRLTQAVNQYRSEMEIYNQYTLLLRSLLEGTDYLESSEAIEEYMRELLRAIDEGDDETVQELLQEISSILQSLKEPEYQNAADVASKLDPNLFSGMTLEIAQDLKMRLKNSEGIDEFENYLRSLEKYIEALNYLEQEDLEKAEQSVYDGLEILEQGQGSDSELRGLYTGLREAYSSLLMYIKGQPEQG